MFWPHWYLALRSRSGSRSQVKVKCQGRISGAQRSILGARLCRVKQGAKESRYQSQVFVCVSTNRADVVDRLLIFNVFTQTVILVISVSPCQISFLLRNINQKQWEAVIYSTIRINVVHRINVVRRMIIFLVNQIHYYQIKRCMHANLVTCSDCFGTRA